MIEGRDYWERHARKYDGSLRLLGRPLPRMLELTREAVRGCNRVLEVAAGTGLVTTALAKSVTTVIATDYAQAMVTILERRVREAGLGNVKCELADLVRPPFRRAGRIRCGRGGECPSPRTGLRSRSSLFVGC